MLNYLLLTAASALLLLLAVSSKAGNHAGYFILVALLGGAFIAGMSGIVWFLMFMLLAVIIGWHFNEGLSLAVFFAKKIKK